ncbi:hypothetical protein ACHAWF_017786 [Thalassiosira exigua]
MIGDAAVGKSSMLIRFTDDAFDEHIQSTIGVDFKVKHLELDNKRIKLTVWDTAGQERFRTLTSSYYRGAQGVVMVYDVTRRDSFDNLEHWLKEVKLYSPNNGEGVVSDDWCVCVRACVRVSVYSITIQGERRKVCLTPNPGMSGYGSPTTALGNRFLLQDSWQPDSRQSSEPQVCGASFGSPREWHCQLFVRGSIGEIILESWGWLGISMSSDLAL